jgi:hypothetical protein
MSIQTNQPHQSIITVVAHNGLANRLLPLISCYRIASKSNRKINVVFNGTPVRSCIRYDGEHCTYLDLFQPNPNILVNFDDRHITYNKIFNFEYWLDKDMVIDSSGDDNIHTNYGLYTMISQNDDQDSMCKSIRKYIEKPGEIIFDNIAYELGDILKKEFKPVTDLQTEIDKYKAKFKPNMIGFHIRSTDGGFTQIQWGDIVSKLITLSSNWCKESKDNGIFLATDNPKYYIEFASKLTSEQFIFYNPPPVLSNTKSTNDTDKFANDKYNVLCGLIEIHLLGSCHHMIIGTSASTFSVCGMLLAPSSTKKILIKSKDDIPTLNL